MTPSMYADYDPDTVADKILVSECPRVSGYIKRKSYQGLCCMPTEVGGSATMRFADYFITSSNTGKGLRIRNVGGSAQYVTNAGASYSNINAAINSLYYDCTAPLCYFVEDPVIPETQKIG